MLLSVIHGVALCVRCMVPFLASLRGASFNRHHGIRAACSRRCLPLQASCRSFWGAKTPRINKIKLDLDSGLERPTTINTRTTFQSKNRAIKKEKRISRITPKKTLKVPSRRLESRIEKRKVARLIGGPVVRQSACPLWCHLLVRVEPV